MSNPISARIYSHWLGVDTGGTFTDFVYFDGKSIRIHKVLSTPHAPELAILQGIDELQISSNELQLIHGSTVATNAVLEARGAKTVYVANTGFSDVLTIGRQARRELYNLMPEPRPPLIAPEYCLEINTRLSSTGELLQPLQQADIDKLLSEIKVINPQAVAINLLFSFLDASQEEEIKNQLLEIDKDLFVCCSSEVLAEYKEYERGMSTALNAYVGPLMQGYLNRLSMDISGNNASQSERINDTSSTSSVSVLQSNGGTISAAHAGQHAVNLLLSGPAGGLKGAQYVAELAGESRLLSFDMGGTSTDVALMDGRIQLTSEGRIGDYPVSVPMVDMHTIGAGGGSIAYVDAGGLLNVGPQSAGASPGPACYGQGGTRPTVTDANLILGRLRADGFLGQGMSLDIQAARAAMQTVAKPLGLSIELAAEGIVRIANEHMIRALRTISVQRGFDPQDFALTCFGGAGGLHVCALAEALNMQRAIVPVHAGVLSALGMLVASPSRELSHSCIQNLADCDVQQLQAQYASLEQQGVEDMQQELTAEPSIRRTVDLRYKGQSFTLNLPWPSDLLDADLSGACLLDLEQAFHQLHESTYGHDLQMPIELVNLRVSIQGEAPPFELPQLEKSSQPSKTLAELQRVSCYGFDQPLPLYQREQLFSGEEISGPALILEKVSTTLIDKHWRCVIDDFGNLILNRN